MSVELIKMDAEALYDQVISDMERELGEILNPGDERRIVAGNILSVVISAAAQSGAYARGQLLRYSYGDMLDALGELVGVARRPATPAKTELLFSLAGPAGSTVTIPAGTRATPDGQTFFATTAGVSVGWDAGSVSVAAEALVAGSAASGYPVGSINVIVDPVPYVTAVSNTSASYGGGDAEGDDALRARIRQAPGHFSVAGPAGAYRYWAMSAYPGIGDVNVSSPAPCEVQVTVLMDDGALPDQAVLDAVEAVLSADEVRPLTDLVTVAAPQQVTYAAETTYYIAQGDAGGQPAISAAVTAAYEDYLIWQGAKLGRAINPDELRRRLLAAGAYRVELTLPAYQALGPDEVAKASSGSELSYGGLLS